ncbi:hypothetical protein H0H92_005861 [Tricholoma furcatifolium]|nr:hypothetical protein H0H92_005861 [Tricholoma furcatifolium]
MIVTHIVFDPAANWFHHKLFRETKLDKLFRDKLFSHELDKDIYTFWTACNSLEGLKLKYTKDPDKIKVASKDNIQDGPKDEFKEESKDESKNLNLT